MQHWFPVSCTVSAVYFNMKYFINRPTAVHITTDTDGEIMHVQLINGNVVHTIHIGLWDARAINARRWRAHFSLTSNKKLSTCSDSVTCEPFFCRPSAKLHIFHTALVFLSRIRDHRMLRSGVASAICMQVDNTATYLVIRRFPLFVAQLALCDHYPPR